MKKLLSAIAAALRHSVAFVWERCLDTGSFTLKAVASIGATGGSEAAQAVADEAIGTEYATAEDIIQPDDGTVDKLLKQSKALLASLAEDPESPGDGYDRIKRIAQDFADAGWGNSFDLAKLSIAQAEWLEVMSPEMHKLVGEASREDLIAHMKGGKGIRGVIRSDRESVKDWKRSLEMEKGREAYAVETPVLDGDPEWAQGGLAAC